MVQRKKTKCFRAGISLTEFLYPREKRRYWAFAKPRNDNKKADPKVGFFVFDGAELGHSV